MNFENVQELENMFTISLKSGKLNLKNEMKNKNKSGHKLVKTHRKSQNKKMKKKRIENQKYLKKGL